MWLALLACTSSPPGPLERVEAHLDAGAPLPALAVGEPLPSDVRALLVDRVLAGEPAALEALVSLASRAEPAYRRGATVIGDPVVIDALITIASHSTSEATKARRVLVASVSRDQLRSANTAPLQHLNPTDLLTRRLLAKAGLLVLEPGAEQALLQALQTATTGEALAAAVDALGYAATDRGLAAVAGQLRTPLVRPAPGGVRSVRLDVLEALHPHWPAEMVFAVNEITAAKDYRRAETRVNQLLGVTVEGEVPAFFTVGPVAPPAPAGAVSP